MSSSVAKPIIKQIKDNIIKIFPGKYFAHNKIYKIIKITKKDIHNVPRETLSEVKRKITKK